MAKAMKKPRLPKTDSIRKLADFWDRHDLTDFDADLEEVAEPVFARRAGAASTIIVPLKPRELRALARLAKSRGVSSAELVGTWVRQRITPRKAAAASASR